MYELTNVIRHNSEIGISETQSVPDPRLLGFFRQTVAIQIYLILFKNLFNSTWILQVGYRKGRGTRGKTVNIHWITEKAREFQKNIYFCCTDYAKAFDCVDYNKLWKILKRDGNIRPYYLPPEKQQPNLFLAKKQVRTRHETTDWFKTGEGGHQDYIVTLFNFYAECIMWNAGLDESQAGIKIAGREKKRLQGEITTSDMQTIQLEWQKAKRN